MLQLCTRTCLRCPQLQWWKQKNYLYMWAKRHSSGGHQSHRSQACLCTLVLIFFLFGCPCTHQSSLITFCSQFIPLFYLRGSFPGLFLLLDFWHLPGRVFNPWCLDYCTVLAWRIPWTEEPGRLQSMGSQGVGHNWATNTHTHTHTHTGSRPIIDIK